MDIILAGSSRSGKSTLAKRLSKKLCYSYIPIDAVVSAFQLGFPTLGIGHLKRSYADICQSLKPFIYPFISQFNERVNGCIFDGYHLLPSDVKSYLSEDRYEIIYFGYPRVTPEAKLQSIKSHVETDDWTLEFEDGYLLNLIGEFIEQSKFFEAECQLLDLNFVDVSYNFELQLDNVEKYLYQKMGLSD